MSSARPKLLCMVHLPPPVHGASVINQTIVDSAWINNRLQLDVLPLRFAKTIGELGGISVRKVASAAKVAAKLTWSLLANRPNAVYLTISPLPTGFYRDCVYIAIMRMFGVPRIYQLHGKGVATQLGVEWKRKLYAWAFRGAQVIHSSSLVAIELAPVVDDAQLSYVPYGVAEVETTELEQRAANLVPRILFLSNMLVEKGPLVLLAALARLARAGVAFEATFAGSPADDLPIATFHAEVERLGLADRVRYVGRVHGAEKERAFQEHDLFVFPTFYTQEAFPLVLLEAMQHSLPVVTTFEAAIPEIVRDGETGLLVDQRNDEALARALQTLLGDRAARQQLGRRGRERFLAQYTLARYEARLTDTLLRILGAEPGHARSASVVIRSEL